MAQPWISMSCVCPQRSEKEDMPQLSFKRRTFNISHEVQQANPTYPSFRCFCFPHSSPGFCCKVGQPQLKAWPTAEGKLLHTCRPLVHMRTLYAETCTEQTLDVSNSWKNLCARQRYSWHPDHVALATLAQILHAGRCRDW